MLDMKREKAMTAAPTDDTPPDPRLQQGVDLHRQGQIDQAAALYNAVLADSPSDTDAHHLLGLIAKDQGDLASAEARIRQALALAPKPAYRNSLAVVLMAQKQWAPAEQEIISALKEDSEHIDLKFNYAVVAQEMERPFTALARYQAVLQNAPDHADSLNNAAVLLLAHDGLAAAEPLLQRALAATPDHALSLRTLARLRRRQGRFAEALALFEKAADLRPKDPDIAYGRALTLLAMGDYQAGWPAFESRYQVAGNPPRHTDIAAWDGRTPVQNLLLHTEQGFGDAIQFARFIPAAAKKVDRVLLECHPTQRDLFAALPGVTKILDRGASLADLSIDAQAPLMRLPLLQDIREADLPGPQPYLSPKPTRVSALPKAKPDSKIDVRFVGLVGGTDSAMAGAADKCLSLPALARLLRAPGVCFVNLQPDLPQPHQALYQKHRVLDATPKIRHFADTATYLRMLPLTLTIDTATAHLAGAMGRPAWVLLNDQQDWRWTDQTAPYWYPSLRLFRQRAPGDWIGVVDDVLNALAA